MEVPNKVVVVDSLHIEVKGTEDFWDFSRTCTRKVDGKMIQESTWTVWNSYNVWTYHLCGSYGVLKPSMDNKKDYSTWLTLGFCPLIKKVNLPTDFLVHILPHKVQSCLLSLDPIFSQSMTSYIEQWNILLKSLPDLKQKTLLIYHFVPSWVPVSLWLLYLLHKEKGTYYLYIYRQHWWLIDWW